MRQTLFTLLAMTILAASCSREKNDATSETDSLWLVVGSYSAADDEGIAVYSFDPATAGARRVGGLKGISNPSFLTPSADGCLLYALGEDDGPTATANAISFDCHNGELRLLGSVQTKGGAPCYITASPDGRWVLTANYMGASITVIRTDSLGLLTDNATTIAFSGHGTDPERQEQPHLHCVEFTPDGEFLLANDLGLDCIHRFRVNYKAERAEDYLLPDGEVKVAAGTGPRHIVFAGGFAYLIGELSGRVVVFDSALAEIQSIAADSVGARGSGDIHVSPDGRHLYASNRLQADGIAIFAIEVGGQLTHLGYQDTGRHPRNFAITPDGRHVLVACRDENAIEIYSRNADTGLLSPIGRIETPRPVCLKFVNRQRPTAARL